MKKRETLYLELGEKITVLRKRKGMTRKELAKKAGISYFTLGYYERGEFKPPFFVMELIAAALDVSLDDLSTLVRPGGTR